MREQLTRKDVEKIEQEIEHRKLVVRKEAIEAVKEARAQGDLSENFEYYAYIFACFSSLIRTMITSA